MRIRSTTALGVFLGLAPPLSASTAVPALIRESGSWTRQGSPYVLSGDTRLAPGAVLVLEGGVEIRVPSRKDASLAGGTERVDFVVQGNLRVEGTAREPVRMLPEHPKGDFGALYVLTPPGAPWRHLEVAGGRIVVTGAALVLEDCRLHGGGGIFLARGGSATLLRCQVDDNSVGIRFHSADTSVRLHRTRLHGNRFGLVFDAPAVLFAEESSVVESKKYQAVHTGPGTVVLPSLWWGSSRAAEIYPTLHSGLGGGNFQLREPLAADPFTARVKGFVPEVSYLQRLDPEPRLSAGLLLQVIRPSLHIPHTDYSSTLGLGLTGAYRLGEALHLVGGLAVSEFSSSDPPQRTSSRLSLQQAGVFLRPVRLLMRDPEPQTQPSPGVDPPRRWAGALGVFLEAGGWITRSDLEVVRPRDLDDPSTPLETRSSSETNLHPQAGLGMDFRIAGRHKAELGAAYQWAPLSGERGGFFLVFHGAFRYYF